MLLPAAAARVQFLGQRGVTTEETELETKKREGIADKPDKSVFSCPNLGAADSLFVTAAHCSILFLFGKNCPNID
jgi:hypothetical protein